MYKLNAEEQLLMTNIFSFITVLALIAYTLAYRRVLINIYDTLDQKETTQDDFSIFVTNIPIVDAPDLGVDPGHRNWKIAVSFLILIVFIIVAFEFLVMADPLRDFLVSKLER